MSKQAQVYVKTDPGRSYNRPRSITNTLLSSSKHAQVHPKTPPGPLPEQDQVCQYTPLAIPYMSLGPGPKNRPKPGPELNHLLGGTVW